ncbi:unnamed protein product [Clonostachys solani]|uniref:Magnesium transporter n=1 Tax=Clonostachys solani TaxID=160281 RepID=A0A9N9VX14_9HYPO|nr:unnamed protein product [Clonostachys solani]
MSVWAAGAAPRTRFPIPSRRLLRFLHLQTTGAPKAASCTYRTSSFSTLTRAGTPRSCAHSLYIKKRCFSPAQREISSKSLGSEGEKLFGGKSRKRSIVSPNNAAPTSRRLSNLTESEISKAKSETKTWQERLWGATAKKGGKPLHPNDLPDHDNSDHGPSMFNNRRSLAAKAALEPRLRCTEVDEHGNVILVDGEFKKTELIAKYGLLPRDLRKIDSSNLPHILIRPSAILLNLLHLKVLIKHDRVLLFDVYGSKTSYPQSAFMYDLQGKLQQKSTQSSGGGLPYEFRALEAVLTSVTSEMEADFEAVREPVMQNLNELEDDIDRQRLRNLLILSKRVSTFEQKAKLVRDAIEDLLEADDDLAAMYLTEKANEVKRALDDHTEVEMLLESYHKLTDEIVQEAGNLVSGIRNTEEIIRAILDANRNALMLLDLKFSVGTLGLAMGTFLAGLYGMNLENFIEETNWGFAGVTGISTIFSLLVCWYGLGKLRKVQRIKMTSGDRPHLPRSPLYHHDEGALGLLDLRTRERVRRMNMHKPTAKPKRTFWPWR